MLDDLSEELRELEVDISEGEVPLDEALEAVVSWSGDLAEKPASELNIDLPEQTGEATSEIRNRIAELSDDEIELVEGHTGVDLNEVDDYLQYVDKGTFDIGQSVNDMVSDRIEGYVDKIKTRANDMMTWSNDFADHLPDYECRQRCRNPRHTKPTIDEVPREIARGTEEVNSTESVFENSLLNTVLTIILTILLLVIVLAVLKWALAAAGVVAVAKAKIAGIMAVGGELLHYWVG